jgi:hypothetical protein
MKRGNGQDRDKYFSLSASINQIISYLVLAWNEFLDAARPLFPLLLLDDLLSP